MFRRGLQSTVESRKGRERKSERGDTEVAEVRGEKIAGRIGVRRFGV